MTMSGDQRNDALLNVQELYHEPSPTLVPGIEDGKVFGLTFPLPTPEEVILEEEDKVHRFCREERMLQDIAAAPRLSVEKPDIFAWARRAIPLLIAAEIWPHILQNHIYSVGSFLLFHLCGPEYSISVGLTPNSRQGLGEMWSRIMCHRKLAQELLHTTHGRWVSLHTASSYENYVHEMYSCLQKFSFLGVSISTDIVHERLLAPFNSPQGEKFIDTKTAVEALIKKRLPLSELLFAVQSYCARIRIVAATMPKGAPTF